MKKAGFFVLVFFLMVITATTVNYLNHEKKGVVVNQRLFQRFNGRVDLEAKLERLRLEHASLLDSMASQSGNFKNQQDWLRYYEKRDELQAIQQEAAQMYTEQIWRRLNDYVNEYGLANNYDMILGANGDGGLMYVNKEINITDEVLQYANKKYDGK